MGITPKGKALELIYKFNKHCESINIPLFNAKKCALILVDELIGLLENTGDKEKVYFWQNHPGEYRMCEAEINYWNEVKKEIELLK